MPTDATSGFVHTDSESDYLINADFTMRQEVASHGFYRMVKAMRYGRWYMLKGLAPKYIESTAHRIMLHKEFEIAVSLAHPNIVQTITFEDVPGMGLCIVMEWIDGVSLDKWLPGRSRREKECVLSQILGAVEYMHQRQVVHRDLKPGNVMVTRNGSNVKLIDFGISDKDDDSRFKQPAGTAGYISPEQQQSKVPDQRNDIYSLGCIISDMGLGWGADRIARRCRSKISRRYSDIGHLRKALHRRRWPLHALVCALAVALIASLVLALKPQLWPEPQQGDIVTYIESSPEVHFGGLECVRFGCDTMQFLRYDDNPGEAIVSLGYADPEKCLNIPERIAYKGDTLTVTAIGYKAFLDACFSRVALPGTLETINDFAFWNSGIVAVDVPDGVKYIAPGAFGKCGYLRTLSFGSGVSVISRDAFMGSSLIRDIWMRSTRPPLLEPSANYDYSATVHVPRGTLDLYRAAPTWELFSDIVEYDLQ